MGFVGLRYSISPMPIPTVLVILADGFEEIEAVTPIDLLRRAGARVTLSSLGESLSVTGRTGISLAAEVPLDAVGTSAFDCVLIPGGPGVALLRADPRVAARLRLQAARGGWIGAICAAPLVLKDAGLLEGKRFTAHPSVVKELPDALGGERTVVDGKLFTSRGAGTALDFGLLAVENLFGRDAAASIAKSICS